MNYDKLVDYLNNQSKSIETQLHETPEEDESHWLNGRRDQINLILDNLPRLMEEK